MEIEDWSSNAGVVVLPEHAREALPCDERGAESGKCGELVSNRKAVSFACVSKILEKITRVDFGMHNLNNNQAHFHLWL